MKKPQDFFDIQELILKNSLLIFLLHSLFYPDTSIKLGTTVIPTEQKTLEILKERKPQSAKYFIIAEFDGSNKINIGLQFDDAKYPNTSIIWKMTYFLSSTKLQEIVNDIFTYFPIHPGKTDYIFQNKHIPKSFITYLQKSASVNLWKCGFKRKNEKVVNSELSINEEINAYKEILEQRLCVYRTVAKLLLKLLSIGSYSFSASYETYEVCYIKKLNAITACYQNYNENFYVHEIIPINKITPSTLECSDFPLERFLFTAFK